jgi:glutamyl-Q tRNA(Asp) synthetase
LHFGSLVAAVGSYLAARSAHGQWFVRIEDLDRSREVPGAADRILRTLEAFGFEWDGPIMRQSERTEAYRHALEQLTAADLTFACSCTRAEIEQKLSGSALQGATDELVYLGTCRRGVRDASRSQAIRFKVSSRTVTVMDQIQGAIELDVYRDIGDFVIKRRDGFFAYQLAVVVDDAAQAITEVVRGADLLTSTHRQRLLQEALGLRIPEYAHLPVVTDAMGQKLSKSERALAIEPGDASDRLWLAMNFLQQNPPLELRGAPLATLWKWGCAQWSVLTLKGLKSGNAPHPGMHYARTHAQA